MSPIYPIFCLFLCIGALSCLVQAVQYQVNGNVIGTAGSTRFENVIGIPFTQQPLQLATEFIWQTFKQNDFGDRNVDQVSVVFESFTDFVAYTQNNTHLNADYIQTFNGDVRTEILGILYHETTHVWQWNGYGETPKGLTEGIANYVRLKSGYASPGWAWRGTAYKWDQGYAVTAYFPEYCEGLRDGCV